MAIQSSSPSFGDQAAPVPVQAHTMPRLFQKHEVAALLQLGTVEAHQPQHQITRRNLMLIQRRENETDMEPKEEKGKKKPHLFLAVSTERWNVLFRWKQVWGAVQVGNKATTGNSSKHCCPMRVTIPCRGGSRSRYEARGLGHPDGAVRTARMPRPCIRQEEGAI